MGGFLLGMADDAPYALAVQRSITLVLLVGVELVVGKNLKSKARAEDEDGQVMGPFEGCREGGSSTLVKSQQSICTVTG